MQTGFEVKIQNLVQAAELNGRHGICERWDASAGRWTILLQTGQRKALKPANLVAAGACARRSASRHIIPDEAPLISEVAEEVGSNHSDEAPLISEEKEEETGKELQANAGATAGLANESAASDTTSDSDTNSERSESKCRPSDAAGEAGSGNTHTIGDGKEASKGPEPDQGINSETVGTSRSSVEPGNGQAHPYLRDAQLLGEVVAVLEAEDLRSLTLRQLRRDVERRLGLTPGQLDTDEDRTKISHFALAKLWQLNAERGVSPGIGDGEALSALTPSPQRGIGERISHAPSPEEPKRSQGSRMVAKCSDGDGPTQSSGARGLEKNRQPGIRMTKRRFQKVAEPIRVSIGEKRMRVNAAVSKEGVCGFHAKADVAVKLDGARANLSCRVTCIVDGSKEWLWGGVEQLRAGQWLEHRSGAAK